MRLLAIGDIHGCYDALEALEAFVPIQHDDMIVALGDYVDRGPDSKKVVEWVRQRTDLGMCIPLRGNHEIMMLAALKGEIPMGHWLQFGGVAALASYEQDGGTGTSDDIPIEHLRFLMKDLKPFHETDEHIFVHATAAPDLPMEMQSDHNLFWERFDWMHPHRSGKTIICGHTAQHSGEPADIGYAICIDTWAYGDGWLTCLDVHSGEYWQANQMGETRSDRLAAP